ncbi:MAG: hypothetical protein LUD19_06270 [Clostridia bacterium]|nr:hypothetical protein [Clostridia bacterium]
MAKKTANKTAEYLYAILTAEFNYCREHVVYWANNYCVIEDKDAPEVVVPFHGWEAQNKTLEDFDNNRLNLILKARQMGVTWIALYYCLHDLIFNPGHTVVALSKTEDDAKELVRRATVILTNQPEIMRAGGLKWSSTATQVTIQGEKLTSVFKAFPASPSAGRSFTGNILLLDEWAFQEFADEIWTSAYPTINRPTGGKVIGLSTIKKGTLFERLWLEDNAFHKIFLSVFCDPRRTQEWYDRTAKDLGVLVKQEYPRTPEEALANVGGSFFAEFDYSKHTCEPFTIPSDWTIYDTMDYGLDMFAHYKIAIDNDNIAYVFHEIYESGLVISDAAAKVKAAELTDNGDGTAKPWYPPRVRLAPPDLWNRSQESGKSRALIFYENGLTLTQSNNDRKAGSVAIKELLKERTAPNGERYVKLKIFRTCTNLIRCLPQILIDEKDPDNYAKEPHELTHSTDALRYFAIYWTQPPKEKKPPKVKYRKDLLEDYLHATKEE